MDRTFRKSDINDIVEALSQARAYFDARSDADGDSEGFIPNVEMQLLMMCETALECFSREEVAREARADVLADYREECKADWQRTGDDE